MLLGNLLPFVEPGCLLRGELPLPVFRTYWPLARADSFGSAGSDETADRVSPRRSGTAPQPRALQG